MKWKGKINFESMPQLNGSDLITESAVNTISGALSAEIDSDITTHSSSADHDGRYYTETEVDALTWLEEDITDLDKYTQAEVDNLIATVSGNAIDDHGELNGLADDDHSQYYNAARLTSWWSTASGTIDHDTILNYAANEHFTEASIDHGAIVGLGDDDHTIYALVNAGRNITGQQTFEDNVIIQGDLVVSGTEFITETETVQIGDNLLLINYGEVGAGVTAGEAGIEIDRGSEPNYRFMFDEANDHFEVGVSGTEQAVATREDSPTDTYVAWWDDGNTMLSTVGSLPIDTVASDSDLATLSGTIDHNTIINNHNLTTDIDHDALTNFDADEHFTWASVSGTIDHDTILNYSANEHFTQAAISITESQISDLGTYLENVVEDTTPQLGGDLVLDENSVKYIPGSLADQAHEGEVATMTIDSGQTIALGNVLFMASDFELEESDADASATMPVIAMTLASGTGSQDVLLKGFIRNDAGWNWAAGPIYADTALGGLTQTKPDGSGDRVQRVGWAYSADIMFFDPDSTDVGVV